MKGKLSANFGFEAILLLIVTHAMTSQDKSLLALFALFRFLVSAMAEEFKGYQNKKLFKFISNHV